MILNRMREPWIAALHSRPQNWDLFGQRHGSRALAGVRKQEFRLPAQPQKFETITVTIRLQKWPAVALARYPPARAFSSPEAAILVVSASVALAKRIAALGMRMEALDFQAFLTRFHFCCVILNAFPLNEPAFRLAWLVLRNRSKRNNFSLSSTKENLFKMLSKLLTLESVNGWIYCRVKRHHDNGNDVR